MAEIENEASTNITPEIDEKFKNFIPPLSKREYNQLEENILRDGCKSPISVMKGTKKIIDGYNRFDICTKHGLPYDVVEIELADRDEAKLWMITNQFGQRELTPYARAELALSVEYVFHKKGLKNKSIAGKIGARLKKDLSNLTKPEEMDNKSDAEKVEIEKINTRKILAEFAEISEGSMAKAIEIRDKATEEQKQKLRIDKTIRIDAIYKVIKEKERETKPKTEENIETEPEQPPQKNEHGVYSIIPEPVKASFVKVKEENLYEFNGDLLCVISIGQKECDCLITPVTGEDNNFFFKLPNVKYLIVDYSSIFESMLPIVVDSTDEQEYFTCFRTFPDEEWNTFVESRFPQLVRKKQESVEIEIQSEKESQNVDETQKDSVDEIETVNKIDKSFILYVGKRDMGVIIEFNNRELDLADQCHAIQKEQENTELWDNIKHVLIFVFKGEWKPEAIITATEEKINEYLDAEEPRIPDILVYEEKDPQELVKLDKTQQEPENNELVSAKSINEKSAKERREKKEKKEKTIYEEKKPKQSYTHYDTQIPNSVMRISLNAKGIIEGLGLKEHYKSLDYKGKHNLEEGISKRCKVLVKKGILEIDNIASEEKGSAHYIAKQQSEIIIEAETMKI
jgi:hypothetical protein